MSTTLPRIVIILIAVSLGADPPAPAQPSASPPEGLLTASEMEELVAGVRELHSAALDALEEMPADRFDPALVLEEVSYEPAGIADWVERNTRWVPYRGALRGAPGVLLDRQGNSLDRSLLLAALLEDAGYDTRLSRAELPAPIVDRLLDDLDPQQSEPLPLDWFETAAMREIVAEAVEQSAALARIAKLAASSGNAELGSAAADHWWVEVEDASGWRALDPLLSGLPASERPAALERFTAAELPDEHFHRVTVSLVIERWDGGAVTEEVPLTHSLRAADAPVQHLELLFVPFGFAPAPEGAGAVAEIRAVAATTEDWLPLLRIGERRVQQQGFGRDGRLERNPAKPVVGRKLEGAIGALGSLGAEESAPRTELSGCWIEYRLEAPGRAPQIVRRELFDLPGPARRRDGDLDAWSIDADGVRERGLALLGRTRILLESAAVPQIAFEKAWLELWARQGPLVAGIVRLAHDPTAAEPLGRLQREPLIPLDLLAIAVVRGDLSRFPSATYLAQPNLLSVHDRLDIDDDMVGRGAVDLVANHVGVLVGDTLLASTVRLEQGVLDTVLEAALVDGSGASVDNTAELFARRDRAGAGWTTLDGLEGAALPADVKARMSAAGAAGRVVVAPRSLTEGEQAAWWEIDPVDGTTLGIGARGWGQSGTEEAVTQPIVATGTQQGASALSRQQWCKLAQAASWVSDVYDFQSQDRARHELEKLRIRQLKERQERLWRAKNLMTPQKLDILLKLEKLGNTGCSLKPW